MTKKWFIGTLERLTPADTSEGQANVDLSVEISEEQYNSFLSAAQHVQKVDRGALYRLVFVNHRTLKEYIASLAEALRSEKVGRTYWAEAHLQLQLIFANWLSSIRWLLDHTKSRLSNEPEKLEHFVRATNAEFEGHFAYRLSYKLRDYVTHCDLPPVNLHAESTEIAPGRTSHSLRVELDSDQLLERWTGWKAAVKHDLRERTEPIDLTALADATMECINRLMFAIVVADLPDHQSHARQVLEAVDRLPGGKGENGSSPGLFAVEMDDGAIRRMTPSALPIEEAHRLLTPPTKDY